MASTERRFKIFIDIPGYESPASLFHSLRPDVVLLQENEAVVIELTVCFETNTQKARDYKQARYKELQYDMIKQAASSKLYCLEVTTLGFLTKNIKELESCLKKTKIDTKRLLKFPRSLLELHIIFLTEETRAGLIRNFYVFIN